MYTQEVIDRKAEAATPSNHHIISKCQEELFDVLNPRNITKIRTDTHRALHMLFRDDELQPIHEPQLQMKRFFEIIRPIVSRFAMKYIKFLVNMPKEAFYRKGLVKVTGATD